MVTLPLDSWIADLGLCAAMFTACVDTLLEFVIQMGDMGAQEAAETIEIRFRCEAAC